MTTRRTKGGAKVKAPVVTSQERMDDFMGILPGAARQMRELRERIARRKRELGLSRGRGR